MKKEELLLQEWGAVTPTGNNVDTFWNSCKEGKVGIDRITKFDTSDFKGKACSRGKGFQSC